MALALVEVAQPFCDGVGGHAGGLLELVGGDGGDGEPVGAGAGQVCGVDGNLEGGGLAGAGGADADGEDVFGACDVAGERGLAGVELPGLLGECGGEVFLGDGWECDVAGGVDEEVFGVEDCSGGVEQVGAGGVDAAAVGVAQFGMERHGWFGCDAEACLVERGVGDLVSGGSGDDVGLLRGPHVDAGFDVVAGPRGLPVRELFDDLLGDLFGVDGLLGAGGGCAY